MGIISSSGVAPRASATDALNPTASPVDSSLVAWSGVDGVYAERAGTAVAFVPGQAPLGPSIDRYGWVWGPATSASTLSVGGEPMVPLTSPSSRRVRGDPRGSCLARRLARPGGSRVDAERVGGRHRARPGRAAAGGAILGAGVSRRRGHRRLVDDVDGLRSRCARGSGEDDQLVTMTLGGLPSSLPLPIRVSSMSAGASSASVVIVGTDDAGRKQVLVRSGALWQNIVVDVSSARYAG